MGEINKDLIDNLNYDQLKEVEKQLEVAKETDSVYWDFMKYCKLSPQDFSPNKMEFKVWSDSHNATYVGIAAGAFYYRCKFLHEDYMVTITKQSLFNYKKRDYRGYAHFKSYVEQCKKEAT